MIAPSANTILNRFMLRAKFRHMQVLIKLTELGSMRRAAEAVGMTQPAISQQVSELEALIGAELFFRHAKGVEPTEVTRDLLPVAKRVLGALQDGSETIANRLSAQSGTVRLSASPAAIGGMLSRVLGPFSRACPDVQVDVVETAGADPLDGLVDDRADVICTRAPQIVPTGWQFVPCLEDRLVVVCGAQHPLARHGRASAETLGAQVWLMNRVGSVARQSFEDAAVTFGWPEATRCKLIVHVPELTRALLGEGDRLAILPQSVAHPWLLSGDAVMLETPITRDLPPLGYLWRAGVATSAARRFVQFVDGQSCA